MNNNRLVLSFLTCGLLALFTACPKSRPVEENKPPGPPTHLGEHMTPQFQRVTLYMRFMSDNLQGWAMNGEFPKGKLIDCVDPQFVHNYKLEGTQAIRCIAYVDSMNKAHILIEFENGWIMQQDDAFRRLTVQQATEETDKMKSATP